MDWYGHLRPWLFRRPPEEIHHLTLRALQWMPKVLFTAPKMKPVHCMGIEFPNRVGLAAGCDVSGDYFPGLFKLGFGHIEVGTVTPKPQEGNPQPRMFRYPDQSVLINRMGFANKGVDYLVERLQKVKDPGGILGISIGKKSRYDLRKRSRRLFGMY